MKITSFGQQPTQQNMSFKLSRNSEENISERPKNSKGVALDPDDFKAPDKFSQNNIEFQIERVINESSKYLHDGLGKIFDRGEALLAGKTSDEYNKHINELSKAIQGQDFKNAEQLIDRFYSGDTEKVINRVQSLAKSSEEKFWDNLDDSLKFLAKDGNRWEMVIDGKIRDDLTTHDIAKMAIQKSREEVDAFSSTDLSETVISAREASVTHAKGKLRNAGQNRYSENAASVTGAATDFARNMMFNTDDANYEEDDKVLKDIRKLRKNDKISSEQIDRLKFQNTRKGDSFTQYMRGRSESFMEAFNELKLKATPTQAEEPVKEMESLPESMVGKDTAEIMAETKKQLEVELAESSRLLMEENSSPSKSGNKAINEYGSNFEYEYLGMMDFEI